MYLELSNNDDMTILINGQTVKVCGDITGGVHISIKTSTERTLYTSQTAYLGNAEGNRPEGSYMSVSAVRKSDVKTSKE